MLLNQSVRNDQDRCEEIRNNKVHVKQVHGEQVRDKQVFNEQVHSKTNRNEQIPGEQVHYPIHFKGIVVMGRPRIRKESLRSVNFTIRLTIEEQKRLEKAAAACAVSPSALVRQKVLQGKFPTPGPARIDLDTYLELKKIGVNLNQLTRLANAGKLNPKLTELLLQLWKQQQKITNQLLAHDRDSENR